MELVSRFAIESLHIGGYTIFIEYRKLSSNTIIPPNCRLSSHTRSYTVKTKIATLYLNEVNTVAEKNGTCRFVFDKTLLFHGGSI